MPKGKKCAVAGCGKPVTSKRENKCNSHAYEARRARPHMAGRAALPARRPTQRGR